MASINTFVQDSKLKFRRIYDTKKVTMNDFTRNAIEKRVGCSDNKGIKCIGKNIKVCDNQYNITKCNTIVDRFKDEFGSFVYPGGITGPFLDKFIVLMKYLDTKSINNLSLLQLQQLNSNESFGFNNSQLDIIHSYFDSSEYVDNVSPVPSVFDKYYKTFSGTEQEYDIGDIDIANTVETDYYYYIASEQDRTQQNVYDKGLKGPIDFILGTSGDPKKTTYYYTVDDWETTRIFTDNIQLDNHKYITLKIHETDYRGGIVNLHFYSIEEGYKKSPIVSQKFIIKNFDNITKKPAGGKRIPYYIEYLSNWFDIDKLTGDLIPPFTRDTTIDPYKDVPFNENDKVLLKTYIRYLKSYNYTGPTSTNRTKLALPFGGDVVDINQAKSYIYGEASTQKVLNGLKLNDFLKNRSAMAFFNDRGKWLDNGCLYQSSNDSQGGVTARDTFGMLPVDRVSFRMNGSSFEIKTSHKCKIKEVTYVLNADADEVTTEYGKGNFTAFNNLSVANKLSVNNFNDPSGKGSFHHNFEDYVSFPEWSSIASFPPTGPSEEDKRLAAQQGYDIKDIIYYPERIVNVKISVTDYCEGEMNEYEKRITPRDARLDLTPTWNGDFSEYTLGDGGHANYLIKRNAIFNSEALPIATDYSVMDAYRLGAKFRIKLLYNDEAESEIKYNGKSWKFIPQDYDDNIAFMSSTLTHQVRQYERISYMKPNTNVVTDYEYGLGSVAITSLGLRGAAISAFIDLTGATWQGAGHVKYSINGDGQLLEFYGASGTYKLPGVDSAKDLIGWKVKARFNDGLYPNKIRDPKKDITYTIRYSFWDVNDGVSDYDPENLHVGFASVNTDGDSSVKIINSDAGFISPTIDEPSKIVKEYPISPYSLVLASPDTVPVTSAKDAPYLKPIDMDKYHPDTKAVVATGGNDFSQTIQYVKIFSDEYLKYPWDHSLLKSEIKYTDA